MQDSLRNNRYINRCQATTGWTILGDDTDNFATTTRCALGSTALEFDKVNGSDNSKLAGVERTETTAFSINNPDWIDGAPHDDLYWYVYVSAKTDVDYVFVRLGTDDSNYVEYQVEDTDITSGQFTRCAVALAEYKDKQGTGVNFNSISYVAIGVAFGAETDTLADIAVGPIGVFPALAGSSLSTTSTVIDGDVSYRGTWNANTNTPTLASGVGTKGYYYVVSTAGTTNLDGITDWQVGDWAIFNGTVWEKVDNTDQVTSVFGRQGAVVAVSGDYTHAQIGSQTTDDHHARDHSATHSQGGTDEVTVENLATAGAANTVPKSDGAGGLAMGSVAHSETSGQTANDHHNQDHSTTHWQGALDQLNVEELGTSGGAGTYPKSDGVGGVSMSTITHAETTGQTTDDHHAQLHQSSHNSGGGDALKLDDLATPDDNTDLDSTTNEHGLLPKLGGGTTNFLRADGTWADPKPTDSIIIACSDETSALTTGTGKVTFRMPYAFTLSEVRASVGTAPTGSVLTVDINESGTTILSTKITIDATEKTSETAATPPVISDTSLADDAEMTVDIDTVGSTIAGAGLKVTLIGTRT